MDKEAYIRSFLACIEFDLYRLDKLSDQLWVAIKNPNFVKDGEVGFSPVRVSDDGGLVLYSDLQDLNYKHIKLIKKWVAEFDVSGTPAKSEINNGRTTTEVPEGER